MRSGKASLMERVAAFIVDKRNIIFLIYIAAAVFCIFSSGWVEVSDSLTKYLPESTETQIGLELMDDEFKTFGTARIVVENVSYEQAEKICADIERVPGVKEVAFDDSPEHYNEAAALFSVTFDGENDDEVSVLAMDTLRDMLSVYDLYVNTEVGNPLKAIINRELLIVDGIAALIIVVVLLFTSKTYAEIPVLLITFGAAALLNMGTNYMMGEISFVTDSVAIVLQLAMAIDYAIILCHRYMEEHENKAAREAAIAALSKAIPEISASSLTTVSGLLALTFMQYRLGYDIGVVMIKAIILSLCSVFLLMPGLLVTFSGLIDRTHHRSFIPKVSWLGRFAYKTRFVMPPVFAILLVLGFVFSGRVNYVYSHNSVDSIRHNENQIAYQRIEELFGIDNQMAIIVPAGDYGREAKLISEVEELSRTVSITGLANIKATDEYYLTSELTPRQFAELADLDYEVAQVLYTGYAMDINEYGQVVTNLENYAVPLLDMFCYLCDKRDEVEVNIPADTEERLDELEQQINDAKLQLKSDNWSRIVLYADIPTEGEESYNYLEIIHGITARYYDEAYVVGDTTSCKDLRTSFEKDNLLISVLSIVFVISVLLFTFKSAGLPVLLILVIQGSIWINFSVPYLLEDNLFFLTYLIISAIQMGANIDYAIVISSRFMELRESMPLKKAIVESMNLAFPTIVTSGTMLASAGLIIGLVTSDETVSAIGVYLGMGTAISIMLVLFVLPQILLLGDILIRKTKFTISRGAEATTHTGIIRINGRVRGTLDGIVDAEIHGVFKGTLNAVIDMGSVEELPEIIIPEPDRGGGEEQ